MMTLSRSFPSLFAFAAMGVAIPGVAADVTVVLDANGSFVIENSNGSVQRLRVDEATGNISRNGTVFVHTTGTNSTFVGRLAGSIAATGSSNSAVGDLALDNLSSGDFNSAFGTTALRMNTIGDLNSAFGREALSNNNTGSANSAFGSNALWLNVSGVDNSAFGRDALSDNTSSNNSAFGSGALQGNTNGSASSAFGRSALLLNTSGSFNTALGVGALASNTTGGNNIAVGVDAGVNQTTGSDNIYIGNPGVADESGFIRIGDTAQTRTFIEGISGSSVGSPSTTVVINTTTNRLGTVASSARFKEAVTDMGGASDVLERLRPVRFLYRKEAGGDGRTWEYGLIAEEVATVAPDLVTYDDEGRPFSVRYHELPALLLNEIQQQQHTIEALEARLAALERERKGTASEEASR